MTRKELAEAVAAKTGLSRKEAEAAVVAFTSAVTEELEKGGSVRLLGFGTFETSERAPREGRNPRTGETMKIAGSKAPRFKAGAALKNAVNGKK